MSTEPRSAEQALVPPTVAHVRQKDFTVYIGRAMPGFTASRWANPHPIRDGITREKSLALYEAHLDELLKDPENRRALLDLSGQRLGCWCKPLGCHGDLLVSAFKKLAGISEDPQAEPSQASLF